MTERNVKPSSFAGLIKEILVFYAHVFKHILGLVVLAAIVQAIVSAMMPENATIGLAISLLGSVVAMFFYAWILYHADSVLMGRSETIIDALHVAKKRFLPLLGVLVAYIALVAILGLLGFGMQMVGKLMHIEYLFALITLLIFLFIFTLLAFTMPSVVIDQTPVFKSFEHSVQLVWGHWWRTFGIILVFVIPVVLLSLGVMLLPSRQIWVLTLYEFIYHLLTYPLMISLILLLYHDLKVRHQIAGFKHMTHRASDN